ncbi:MAG: hypothetical protein HY332_10720 [Chloroflexi bacterium]|nr:hypothetical protein [Chloroflexota bacterium]
MLDAVDLFAALACALGHPVGVVERIVIQERWSQRSGQELGSRGRHYGRVVERVWLGDGREVIVKLRNDRPSCREALVYPYVLPHERTLVPMYLGSCTTSGGVLPATLPAAVTAEVIPDSLRRSPADGDDSLAGEPLVFDPGDMRPENCLIAGERVVLIDYENAAVRRRSVALAAVVRDCPSAPDMLAPYFDRTCAVSRFPATRAIVHAGTRLARVV